MASLFGGEDPGGAVGGVWGSSDDDQQLETGAGEARGRVVCARQQGAGGRCAEGDRRSAPQDRAVAGRARFSCRAACHLPNAERRAMIAPEVGLSVTRQCALLGIARSSFYYRPRPEAEELDILKRLDRIFTSHPVYGSRRLQVALLREGTSIGRRRVRRLMRKLGLWAVRPKRNTSKRHGWTAGLGWGEATSREKRGRCSLCAHRSR